MADHQSNCLLTPLTPSMGLCSPIQDQIEELPVTPPDSAQPFNEKPRKIDTPAVRKALHVITNERAALSHLENLYATSSQAQAYLSAAITQIVRCQQQQGKVVFTGIGKSRLVALKLVATFNSLAIESVFLHPTDALHGDLGMIRPNDVVLMITFSGKTPELLSLLPHLPACTPLIAITSHTDPFACPVLSSSHRRNGDAHAASILLPAPIHSPEKTTFGLSAPTTSTTVAMALGDALALTVAESLHSLPGRGPAEVFAQYHPGGAIGAAFSSMTDLKSAADSTPAQPTMQDLATRVDEVPILSHQMQVNDHRLITALDVLALAVRTKGGWVRLHETHIIAPRRIQRLIHSRDEGGPLRTIAEIERDILASSPAASISKSSSSSSFQDIMMMASPPPPPPAEHEPDRLVIEKSDWISIPGSSTVQECKDWIISMREEGDGRGKLFLKRGTILGIVDDMNGVSSVVEIEDVVGDSFFD